GGSIPSHSGHGEESNEGMDQTWEGDGPPTGDLTKNEKCQEPQMQGHGRRSTSPPLPGYGTTYGHRGGGGEGGYSGQPADFSAYPYHNTQ
ncbi:unnamed protein product, partial [Discosporangium mesarthrocarpum]